MDPNRYSKNSTIRPDSIWKILQALATLALMICGFIGIAVHIFGGNYRPTDLLAWIAASPFNIGLVVIGLMILFTFHRYITHISTQKRQLASNLPVYAMMLLGAYYIYQLISTGHW